MGILRIMFFLHDVVCEAGAELSQLWWEAVWPSLRFCPSNLFSPPPLNMVLLLEEPVLNEWIWHKMD